MLQCSDSSLYGQYGLDPSANRLAVTGRVCTDDPQGAGFPVRVIFIMDQAAGPIFSSYDPEQLRIRMMDESLSIHSGNKAFSFAVIGMGPTPRLLAPQEGRFTRNSGELAAATASLGIAQGCVGELCRNYEDSIFMARSLIEGDMADLSAGEKNRTQYVIVLMTGGDPSPLVNGDWPETRTSLQAEVSELKKDIEGKAASFSFHTLQLAPNDSAAQTESLLRELAFSGNGKYERFNSADALTLDHVGLLKLSALFSAKSLIVSNVNVLPGLEGARMDSDGDGLSDEFERRILTDPGQRDTDHDGIGDLVEQITLSQPLVAEEKPEECILLAGPPFGDLDSDLLNDCEELLVGTDGSLTDTDGDGITDWMELVGGTDHLYNDYLEDGDLDGVNNGEEALKHTDPRTNDVANHLAGGYRYDVTDEGVQDEFVIAVPERILGVEVLESGNGTTGGVATLRFRPNPPSLAWKDPQDNSIGPFVSVQEGGEFLLFSSNDTLSAVPGANSTADGTSVLESEQRWIRIYVTSAFLPTSNRDDYLLVQTAQQHCLSFTVRNIQLMETNSAVASVGRNNIYIYFSQAPSGNMMAPGLFRIAHIPITYTIENGKNPSGAILELGNEDFMTVGL